MGAGRPAETGDPGAAGGGSRRAVPAAREDLLPGRGFRQPELRWGATFPCFWTWIFLFKPSVQAPSGLAWNKCAVGVTCFNDSTHVWNMTEYFLDVFSMQQRTCHCCKKFQCHRHQRVVKIVRWDCKCGGAARLCISVSCHVPQLSPHPNCPAEMA